MKTAEELKNILSSNRDETPLCIEKFEKGILDAANNGRRYFISSFSRKCNQQKFVAHFQALGFKVRVYENGGARVTIPK